MRMIDCKTQIVHVAWNLHDNFIINETMSMNSIKLIELTNDDIASMSWDCSPNAKISSIIPNHTTSGTGNVVLLRWPDHTVEGHHYSRSMEYSILSWWYKNYPLLGALFVPPPPAEHIERECAFVHRKNAAPAWSRGVGRDVSDRTLTTTKNADVCFYKRHQKFIATGSARAWRAPCTSRERNEAIVIM